VGGGHDATWPVATAVVCVMTSSALLLTQCQEPGSAVTLVVHQALIESGCLVQLVEWDVALDKCVFELTYCPLRGVWPSAERRRGEVSERLDLDQLEERRCPLSAGDGISARGCCTVRDR